MRKLLLAMVLSLLPVLASAQHFYRPYGEFDTTKVTVVLIFPDNTTMTTAAAGGDTAGVMMRAETTWVAYKDWCQGRYSLNSHNHSGVYQAAGTYLIPGDSTHIRNRSNVLYALTGHNHSGTYQPAGTYLIPDDSTHIRNRSNALYALLGHDHSSVYQPVDADLTTLAGLTATTDNFIVSVASAWASRTPAQVRSTLGVASYSAGAGEPTGGNNGDLYWDTTGLFFWQRSGDTWRQLP